ncbi:polyprenyl synthetase family protein [Desulfitobacterium metallireducens]|uniref:Geranylgeranyl pyrophosphate synthase n=1 Tax=Desulfitobacterium metallireducens DSM 15288 TaxID=871968 RepID=W0EDR6_9FIRM|nr:polyprenyl synthetase family protein [Desulfitobacterium metallireducens]AHF07196.1 geranylgeranyl pyrophosphate synthase [Desulfitobacterium metallireducens DSM 15288]
MNISTIQSLKFSEESPVVLPELLIVEEELHKTVAKAQGMILKSCSHLLSSGGKRLRPLLTLHSGMCFGPLNTATLQAAVAAELIHMASLIHDDVIDHSDLRRGQPTINSQQGNLNAVLTGDYLFAEAFQILSSHQLMDSMHYLVEAIQSMCTGEVEQAKHQFNFSLTINDYFERIAQKTGILLASSCRSGAATAGASQGDIERLGTYGMYLGYAYQIIDDLLDYTGNPEQTGKPVGADLINGNLTLPMIYLLNNPLYGPWARELLQDKITSQSLRKIIQALISSDAMDEAFSTAQTCITSALSYLEKIPDGSSKTVLTDLAYQVLYRTH